MYHKKAPQSSSLPSVTQYRMATSVHSYILHLRGLAGLCLVTNVFFRGPYEPPLRNNGTQGVQLLLEGVRTSISRKTYGQIGNCDFPGAGGGWGSGSPFSPLDPYMHGWHVSSKSSSSPVQCYAKGERRRLSLVYT